MKISLYSQFHDPAQAERAMVTLIHRGAVATDMTLIVPPLYSGLEKEATNSCLVPGLGRLLGGGKLARTLGALDAPDLSRALAGGVAAYLQRRGLTQRQASDTALALLALNAVLMIECPSGKLDEVSITNILQTYQAKTFGRSGPVRKQIFAI